MKQIYLMIYDAGGGHRSTANALREVIAERKLPWDVHIVEVFKEIFGTSQTQDVYNNWVLKKKWARLINRPIMVPLFKMQVALYHARWLSLLKTYWNQHPADMVVSLLPFINRVLCESVRAVSPQTPFVTALTDLGDCPPHFWFEKQEQFLICPTQHAAQQARALGHQQDAIFQTSGLILNSKFYQPIPGDRAIERQKLGLRPDLPTGLVMFGHQGAKEILQILQTLETSLLDIQLIVICGRNENLAQVISNSPGRLPKVVKTFTDQVPYYMYLSDFFIGKPGNVSISEAIAMKLPVITEYNALTLMQERYCCEWITENQLGIVISDFGKVDQAVNQLIRGDNLTHYQNRTATLNNQAVFEVVHILEKILENSQSQSSQIKAMAKL